MVNNFQRLGSESNSQVGRNFEAAALNYFLEKGISLQKDFGLSIGFSIKKERRFDLGSDDPPMLVECKSHTWTKGHYVPSAKITVWNESMLYFYLAPERFRKILFVLRDYDKKRGKTLAEYYVTNHSHLIPDGVEIWEYDESSTHEVAVVWPIN